MLPNLAEQVAVIGLQVAVELCEPLVADSAFQDLPLGDEQYAVAMDDTEETPGQVTRRLLELLPAGSGSVGGALVGLALGGPEGALAGAAVEPVLEQVVSETLARRRARGRQALAVAASSTDITPEDLLDRILRDEQLLDLAAAVVAAASETMVEAKIQALGRALAAGALATDDAVVDEQRFLVDILADLEAPHIRVLKQLSIQHEGYGSPRTPDGGRRAYGWSTEDLSDRMPGMAVILRPVLNVLAGRELVRDTAVGSLGYVPGEGERWVVTDTGTRCLNLLEERGHEGSEDAQPDSPNS